MTTLPSSLSKRKKYPHSHHSIIMEQKYKPWRKGKGRKKNQGTTNSSSSTTGGHGSLKNQVRSLQRLLKKQEQETKEGQGIGAEEENKNRSLSSHLLVEKIQQLQNEIQKRKEKEHERKLATKYHSIKFFERQKLTRMYQKLKKKLIASNDYSKDKLQQIQMDLIYVAYFPKHLKYISIFQNGVRKSVVNIEKKKLEQDEDDDGGKDIDDDENDDSTEGVTNPNTSTTEEDLKTARKKQQIWNQIVQDIREGKIRLSKSWVGTDLDWILEDHRNFQLHITPNETEENILTAKNTTRKRKNRNDHDDKLFDTENHKVTATTSFSSSSVLSFSPKMVVHSNNTEDKQGDSMSQSSSSVPSSSSSSNSVDGTEDKNQHGRKENDSDASLVSTVHEGLDVNAKNFKETSSSSSSSSTSTSSSSSLSSSSTSGSSSDDDSSSTTSSSSTESSSESEIATHKDPASKMKVNVNRSQANIDDSDDDFLIQEDLTKGQDAFRMAFIPQAPYRPNKIGTGGDKSKGWATQKQRPGEWKRKIQRR